MNWGQNVYVVSIINKSRCQLTNKREMKFFLSQAKPHCRLVAHVSKALSSELQRISVARRWRFWEFVPLLASAADCSWAGNCLQCGEKGWQGREEDEITAGELLWLSVLRAQWLKVNLEFCTHSDCLGVFSHQTSGCVPSRLELNLSFWFCFLR